MPINMRVDPRKNNGTISNRLTFEMTTDKNITTPKKPIHLDKYPEKTKNGSIRPLKKYKTER